MPRQRALSGASSLSSVPSSEPAQELNSLYDYLAKIILLGPSGSGKSCLLHRFVRREFRVLSSQTIGVEFSSRIIRVPSGKRIKLQLWDTAGQERFRSVTRSYYRGAAGALLVYDVTNHASFASLPTFLSDARQLGSEQLAVVLVGNKCDLSKPPVVQRPVGRRIASASGSESSSLATTPTRYADDSVAAWRGERGDGEEEDEEEPGREVSGQEAARWARLARVPVCVETSALTGEGVEECFAKLARMILTKIELGEVDPEDPSSGVQYGDAGAWEVRRGRVHGEGWRGSLREWESVFRKDAQRRGGGCC